METVTTDRLFKNPRVVKATTIIRGEQTNATCRPKGFETTEQPSDSGSRPSELEAFGNDCVTGKCEI